jgi:hypothetical protein
VNGSICNMNVLDCDSNQGILVVKYMSHKNWRPQIGIQQGDLRLRLRIRSLDNRSQ